MILSGFQDSWADQISRGPHHCWAFHDVALGGALLRDGGGLWGKEEKRRLPGEPGLFVAWVTLLGNVWVFHSVILSHDLIFPRLKAD